MAKGIALTIGLNAVDPRHYAGWSGALHACEADASDMADIAKSRRFTVKTLLTKAATRNQVSGQIAKAAHVLKAGDIFMLTYSGHGGQLPDRNNDEDDGQDETWCLYDGELVDDELYACLCKFARGVRVLVFSDSCHSGTVTKMAYHHTAGLHNTKTSARDIRYRYMPPDVALRTYRLNRKLYDPILKARSLQQTREKVQASVVLISGCQDNQLSSDGDFNGLFTGTLLRVWDDGSFRLGYRALHRAVVKRMPPDQTPNYFRVGSLDRVFEAQAPFTI